MIDVFSYGPVCLVSLTKKKKKITKKLTSKPVMKVLQSGNYFVSLFKDYSFTGKRSSLSKLTSFWGKLHFGWYGNYLHRIRLFLGTAIAYWRTFASKSSTAQWIRSWLVPRSRCQWKVIVSSATVKGIYRGSGAIKNFHKQHEHKLKIFADKIHGESKGLT